MTAFRPLESSHDGSPQLAVVRRWRSQRLHPPGLDAPRPARARLRRPTAHRDRQHCFRPDSLQRSLERGGGERQAGRLRGWRDSAQPAGGVTRRDAGAAHRHALAEHGRDGDGGDAARQSHRRCGSARRLRQDHPGAADGGGLGRPPSGRVAGRTHADGHLPRSAARVWNRCVEAVRGCTRGHLVRAAVPALGVIDDPKSRALQHDGHGVDHGRHGGGAGNDHSRRSRYARIRQSPARGRA